MATAKLTEQEWETFLGLADRMEIPVRALLREDVNFHEKDYAGHRLGRAVAQGATERMALARAERQTTPQPCPTCERRCPVIDRGGEMETGEGAINLQEPDCHCSVCDRDFFPSAS